MKLHILSDLHNEFVPHQADPEILAAADVVVLAGDVDVGIKGLIWVREVFPNHEIVYVAGIHEFYGYGSSRIPVRTRWFANSCLAPGRPTRNVAPCPRRKTR
jgi:predicted phosphodiesterase